MTELPLYEEVLGALKGARRFIRNGIEYGYIRMPDADCPDTAHDTPGELDAAIAKLEAALPLQPLTDAQILDCNNTAAEDQEFSPCITAPDEDLIAFARQVLHVAGMQDRRTA